MPRTGLSPVHGAAAVCVCRCDCDDGGGGDGDRYACSKTRPGGGVDHFPKYLPWEPEVVRCAWALPARRRATSVTVSAMHGAGCSAAVPHHDVPADVLCRR